MVSNQTEAERSPRGLAQTTALIARVLGDGDFPTGDRAKLKRWSPGDPPSLALYRFAFRHLPEGWEQRYEAWTTLTTAIAIMCPDPHRPDVSLGRALANAGYAEARLERLLAAEDGTLRTLLLRSARFLRSKNVACNCTDFARLLNLQGDPPKARMRIARDYFRELQRSQTATPRG